MSLVKSWMMRNSICKKCEYEIVVTQGDKCDYRYYCSNLECVNHINIEDLYDVEDCSFIKKNKEINNGN